MDDDRVDDGLERELDQLGPLMKHQQALDASAPDPVFAVDLRARLIAQASVPDASGPMSPERPTVSTFRSTPRPDRSRGRLRPAAFGPLAGIVLLAAAIVIGLNLHSGGGIRRNGGHPIAIRFVPPTPSVGDVTKSYPLLGGLGGGGLVNPVVSRIEATTGQPYPGRLHLVAHTLPVLGAIASAYQLRTAPTDLAAFTLRLARVLGIGGPVIRQNGYAQSRAHPVAIRFAVVADGTSIPSASPLHSIAASSFDGQVIYHDTRYDPQSSLPVAPASVPRAVAVARAWLVALGWPGRRMTLQGTATLPGGFGGIREVRFGWSGVRHADVSAAVLWMTPTLHISEARLLPPIARTSPEYLRPVRTVWPQVRDGRTPIGVKIITGAPDAPGTGRLTAVSLQYILTTLANGRQYLVPAYRFSGRVRLSGSPGTHPWFALVPALR